MEEKREFHRLQRADGYKNLLNKYGTATDSSTKYTFQMDAYVDDMTLTGMYLNGGLFAKIVDRPAEEALKHGYDFESFGDYEDAIQRKLDMLHWKQSAVQAMKWSRLYGGALIVMLVDDGSFTLEQKLNWRKVKSVDELMVFERPLVSVERYGTGYEGSYFGEPEYYTVSSRRGVFRVHKSRCLVFKNGKVPEHCSNQLFYDWGIPEYLRIHKALQECETTHGNGVRLLERSVQAIYKMRNLANVLQTAQGEDKVLERIQLIDTARGILNSLVIDAEGEDYNFINAQMSGVKEIIDSTCNMLSAVTDIPQTILFGASPNGMNATGISDLENYYNMVERLQEMNLQDNSRKLFDLSVIELKKEGKIDSDFKDFKIEFNKLWSLNEQEQADLDAKKASIEQTKASTAQIYVEMQALDPSEVRKGLVDNEDYEIQDLIGEGEEEYPEDAFRPLQSGQEGSGEGGADPMAQMMGGQGGMPQGASGEPQGDEEPIVKIPLASGMEENERKVFTKSENEGRIDWVEFDPNSMVWRDIGGVPTIIDKKSGKALTGYFASYLYPTKFKKSGNDLSVSQDVVIKGMGRRSVMKKQKISRIKEFAGPNSKNPVRVANILNEKFKDAEGDWSHLLGYGEVYDMKGKKRNAEIHWFDNGKVGQVGWKVKRFV